MPRAPAILCFRFLHYSRLLPVSQHPESRSKTHKDLVRSTDAEANWCYTRTLAPGVTGKNARGTGG